MNPRGSSLSAFRDVGLLSILCLLTVFLTGCVYLRLLEVKRQLQNFDENFAIGGRSELVIEFKNPVMRARDARFLIGGDPQGQSVVNGELIQTYPFELVRPSTGSPSVPLETLELNLSMKEGKLVKIIVPEKFMLLFPRRVVVDTLKQAKDAEVFELKKLARGVIRLDPEIEAELPSREKTEILLGPPLAFAEDGVLNVLTYRYRFPDVKIKVPIFAQLGFDQEGMLHRVFIHWDQSAIEAVFVRSAHGSPPTAGDVEDSPKPY